MHDRIERLERRIAELQKQQEQLERTYEQRAKSQSADIFFQEGTAW